jgi:hypothetical protein
MDDQIFTPNHQLYVFFALFFIAMITMGAAVVLVRSHITALQRKLGPVTPLWEHVLSELSAIMRHPHPWAKEMDELMDEANQEPDVHMEPERFERLLVLLAERVNSKNPELREDEPTAAAVYLAVLPLARREAFKRIDLSGIRLVGSHAPAAQSTEDQEARDDQ